jgi:hypothetical protein
MRTSYRRLQAFAALADAYLADQKSDTRTSYAIKRVRDQITRLSERLQTAMLDVEIDLCVVGDGGVILRDAGGALQFTREGLKERNRKQLALLDEEHEIDPFYLRETPADLTPAQVAAFRGFILHDEEPAEGDELPAANEEELQETAASVAS